MNADTQNGNSAKDQSPMIEVRKFLFEKSFDDDVMPEVVEEQEHEEDEKEEEPEEVVPTFSEEEVNAARDEGFAAGKEEGIREAAEATERDILAVMGQLGEKFSDLFKAKETADAAILDSAISVAVGITRKIFPALNDKNALGEVERMVVKTLEHLLDEPFVTLYLNSGLLAPFEERLEALKTQAGFKGEVKVTAGEDIASGDCRIEWSGGGARRDSAELWRKIDEIVERNLSGEPEEAEAAPEAPEPETAAPAPSVSSDGDIEAEAAPEAPETETAEVKPAPEDAIVESRPEETVDPPAEAPAEEPLDHAQEPEQPETPEDAPDHPGDEDTLTDQEDS